MASILVVDDHPDLGTLTARFLQDAGHDAACAADGLAALDYLQTHRPDLVVLDLMMPGFSGFDVLTALRADGRTSALPVVVYTAVDDPVYRDRAMTLGARAYMVKGRADASDLCAAAAHYGVEPAPPLPMPAAI